MIIVVKKRKAVETAAPSPNPKKSKKPHISKDSDDEDVEKEDDGDNVYEPTTNELQAAEDPENTPNIETTRQKKKDKFQKLAIAAKSDLVVRDQLRNLQYLRLWKFDRVTWKFHKLRQLSIQKSLFRVEDPLDDELWQLSLEYLSGSKGHSRQLLIEAAEKVINETDERINPDNQQELVNDLMYTRARELLQLFQ